MVKKIRSSKKILEKAILIFDEVNAKIDGLIECSVKDFEILNSNFKSLFFNLQELSESSAKVIRFIEVIDNKETEKLFKKHSYIKNENLIISLSANISVLKRLDKNINYFLMILSNIKQDTSTTKLLITNLKFDPIISADYSRLNDAMRNISKIINNNEDSLIQIRYIVNETIKFIDQGIYHNTEILAKYIKKATDSINYIQKLGTEAKTHKKSLNEIESKKASSTSEIITNLQFQDILRQQIEHVQTSHKEITTNLKSTHKEGEPLSQEELHKIRDINTLQSAQLIHANREYQKAVEIILHKINELNSFYNQYNSFWNQFCKPEGIKLQSLQPDFSELLNNLNSHFFSFSLVFEKLNGLLNKTNTKYLSLINKVNSDVSIIEEIKIVQQIINSIETQKSETNEFSPTSQIKSELQKINDSYLKLSNAFKEAAKPEGSENLFDSKLNKEIKSIKEFIQTVDKMNELFQDNSGSFNLHLQLQKTKNFSIEQVSYYKTFEKEVHEIINLLDKLLANINLTKTDINENELEHVKKLYTMESERKIHKTVTGNKPDNKDKSEENNNDVEFF